MIQFALTTDSHWLKEDRPIGTKYPPKILLIGKILVGSSSRSSSVWLLILTWRRPIRWEAFADAIKILMVLFYFQKIAILSLIKLPEDTVVPGDVLMMNNI